MRICIVQAKALIGHIQKNIENHLAFIERAIARNSDLVIFPELSITGYEPELAKELSTKAEDKRFAPFQRLSDENEIIIGVGMPIKAPDGVTISMLIFQPFKTRLVYSKRLLHPDELPFFISGTDQPLLNVKGKIIALGICYETLQREHFIRAKEHHADVYVASVSKPDKGTEKAYVHFPSMAKEFEMVVLMANSVGFCDNFLSNGLSSVWSSKGKRIEQLGQEHQGMLIYDTETGLAEIIEPKILKAQLCDLEEVFRIYLNGKKELERNGIYQWVDSYPTREIVEEDIKKEALFVLKEDTEIIGAINLSEEQEAEYQTVNWKFDDSKVLVIHRLVINPKHQKKGYAQKLMEFAERFANQHNYTSIRLDAYSQNDRVINFYKTRGYCIRGKVNFPEREFEFLCMEKQVKSPS